MNFSCLVTGTGRVFTSNLLQKIEEMRITIEDLEAIKELNDEIEEDHVETEKTLRGDLSQFLPF